MIGSALTAFATVSLLPVARRARRSLPQCTAVLLLARALAGAAAGGIVSSVWVILSEIVAPSKRAAWSMALSVTWCMSAVAGPVLGGVFTGACLLPLVGDGADRRPGSGHSFLSWRVACMSHARPQCRDLLTRST